MLRLRETIQQRLEEQFLEADQHQPDCSVITDLQLQQAIASRWPVTDGVARIPFGFSSKPLLGSFLSAIRLSNFWPETPDDRLTEIMQTTIRFVLVKLAKASQQRIEFIEIENAHLFSSGIFFYLGGNTQHFLREEDAFAFASRRMDNNGNIKQAFVFLPNDIGNWDNEDKLPYPLMAWIHEALHALGFDHLHEFEDMKNSLSNLADGVYCSVLPYFDKIATAVSSCVENCNPPYATYPAALDKRLLSLAYVQGVTPNNSFEKESNYFLNMIESGILSFLIAGFHQSVFLFFSRLTMGRDQPIFSKNAAKMLADLSFFASIVYLELPLWLVGLFAITASAKYFPELEELPLEHLSLSAFNLGLAYRQGQLFFPLAMTSVSNLLGTGLGIKLLNLITEYTHFYTTPLVAIPVPDAVIEPVAEAAAETIMQSTEPSINPHTFFHAKQRQSLCTRLTNWFKGATPVIIEEDENDNLLDVRVKI